ncbi:MAG TPA: hypothetical protein DIU15_00550 [Deltaproteobacteria bacterium]|nr:hypothetical protein [Deltaproteobacteria bacterium]HCP44518.1 hypothetical protein [Deltaproteobacteria bacterium]
MTTSESSPPSAPVEPSGLDSAVRLVPPSTAVLVERALEALDWLRIVRALVDRTSTQQGALYCADLPLFDDLADARDALSDLSEMLLLQEGEEPVPLGGVEDIGPLLQAALKGELLEGPDLLSVAHTLESLSRLRDALIDRGDDTPRLSTLVRGIEPQVDLASWLVGSFDNRGQLSVSTYPQLSSLRGRKAQLHDRIGQTLDKVRTDDRYDGALQDDFSALRNDRYVLPVKAQHKGAGLGIVHDTSGSGQTVFVEPFEIVELNNDLKMADSELRREEHRILSELTSDVARAADAIARSLSVATHLDVVQAKATLARDLQATVPHLTDELRIDLRRVRHPILVLRGLEVVANDVVLGGSEARAMVLSGPNTGGKTITLKTLGLCALMARAGLPVPADTGSVIGWFLPVLTDIGDSQDVEDDLSTFSGHLLCMVGILEALAASSGHSLVLVDEVAAGTDPVQGAALGRAMLEALLDQDALVATTTHYPELKALSATDDRFTNARVEFDGEQGRPTYHLSVGRPGSSHAMDVAGQVGLPGAILERARAFLAPAAAQVEELLSGLEADAAVARRVRGEAEAEALDVRRELASVQKERDELRRQSREVEREIRAEFEQEVRGYREVARGAIRQLREAEDVAAAERSRQRIIEGAARVREAWSDRGASEPIDAMDPGDIVVGGRVRVVRLGKDATVQSLPDGRGRLTVDVGGLRMQVKASELEAARDSSPGDASGKEGSSKGSGGRGKKKGKGGRKRSGGGSSSSSAAPAGDIAHAFRSPGNTLDLRGHRVDEALPKIDGFLDSRLLAGERFAFVLHGLGTGVLRQVVRDHLSSSPYVGDFAPGTRAQGGDGITVVSIRLD